MPAFFEAHFWDWQNPEFWVGVGLVIFLGIIIFVAKAPKAIAATLDAQAAKIQFDLDEAARIHAEAQTMLAEIRAQREQTEIQAKAMLANARDEAKRLEQEAKVKLEEQIARRTALADRRIATAEAQALADVKAAAAELATSAAEAILASRVGKAGSDALVDDAIGQMASKLQ